MLTRLNRYRIQRNIRRAVEAAPAFRYALLGAGYCFNDLYFSRIMDDEGIITEESYRQAGISLEDFIPPHLLRGRESPREYLQASINAVKRDLENKVHFHSRVTGDDTANMGRIQTLNDPDAYNDFLKRPTLAPLQYVMELAGLNNDFDWSMNLSRMPITLRAFQPTVRRTFVKAVLEEESVDADGFLCDQLRTKSMESLGGEDRPSRWWEFWK